MNEMRRAALALHALDNDDRAWVLSRLSDAQRDELSPLVRELDELGFPRHAGALHGQSIALPPASKVAEPARPTPEDALDQTPPPRIVAGLASESPAVLAWLLSRRRWRWARKFRRRLDRDRRGDVAARLERPVPAVTGRVEKELLDLIGRAVGVRAGGEEAGSR